MKIPFLYYIGMTGALLAGTACSDDLGQESVPAADALSLHIGWEPFAVSGSPVSLPGENDIASMKAYHFEEGILHKVYEPLAVSDDSYRLPLDRLSGTLYVVANADVLSETGKTQETDWVQTVLTADGPAASNYFTGKVDLASGVKDAAQVPLTLNRGVARLDFRIAVSGEAVEVSHFVVSQAARQTYLFPSAEVRSPEGVAKGDYTICTPDAPLLHDSLGVMYLYEQVNPDLSVSVEAMIDGKSYSFRQSLPDVIRRNTVYAVVLRKDVLDVDARLTVEAWGEGGNTGLYPDFTHRPSVDVAASELPEDVEVSSEKNAVTLSHHAADLVLAVTCDDELELLPLGPASTLTVEALPLEGAFGGTQRFRIHKPLYPPCRPSVEVPLCFRRKGMKHVYPEDVITLCLDANPSLLSGKISFDVNDYAFDFDSYVDNELGVFTLPSDKELVVEYGEGEDPWIKIESAVGEGVCRVLAGWRPNDPTADGHRQEATLVIRNRTDGAAREEYTVSRLNYGLPVTWFHGIWWCKYNARGNSRSFDDQVLSAADPAREAGQTLFQYLESCPPEAFFDLWQWAYQGDSGQGMRVIDCDGVAVMDGYNGNNSVHINRLPADALSPAGYELPSMEDFNRIFDATGTVWVMWDGIHTLKTPWEGHDKVKRLQKRRNDVTVGGTLALPDLITIEMSSPDFPEHEPIVWYGVSAQWNDAGIYHGHYNNMLFGVCSPEGSGWYISGGMSNLYLHKNGAGTKDTRILRFRKSPVEYVY